MTDTLEAHLKFPDNQRCWQLILAAMFVLLALIAFWPTPVDQPVSGQLASVLQFVHSNGVPGWFNYRLVEASANIALFVPLGFVSRFAFVGKPLWQIGAFGLLVSGSIELGQLLFLHNRFASLSDILMNTTGTIIGALLAAILRSHPET
ncbi:glycopeptide antibiotics resistance protein [Arthrobacter sp. SORGH_AS 212]|uniref:VanZ family protein n=1 Tax=Pseudarthrobacter sp. SORGH_AS 212 TaxID=3041777 RepID=UPI002785BAF5|nr:glycopeptide antibiotics resistance protein [Arthrobacter sp. SORGH_AS_0212]